MALVNGAELAQGVQLVLGGVAGLGHDGVKHRRGVPLGENEAVAIHPGWIVRSDAHVIEVQLHQNFDGRERPAGMARPGRADHLDNLAPYLLGKGLQFGKRFRHAVIVSLALTAQALGRAMIPRPMSLPGLR